MEFERLVQTIGQNIVRLREKQSLRQVDLALKLGIEDSALRRIESGRTNPTIKTLNNIAEALEVRIEDLIIVDETHIQTLNRKH